MSPSQAASVPFFLTPEEEEEYGTADNLILNDPKQEALIKEEQKARLENEKGEQRRQKLAAKKKKENHETRAEREAKAKQLDNLLASCAKFSEILTKKTEVLGRVGSGFDQKALGEHDLELAKQPACMVGGTMRDYQLEGLTWMFEICLQGMSGILADEMGLGKTIQTISLLAKFREDANYLGPHLIIAPLSTLSNWEEEFKKWVPSIPFALYHGTPSERKIIYEKKLQKNFIGGRVSEKFPVVLSTPEIVIKDASSLSKIHWEIIIIDEGHRLKNSDSKFFRILRSFTSVTRFLITGTPLQNNLKELWSLLNFLLPNIFVNWEQFESWFDFSDLQDEEGTQEFLQDRIKQDLVQKIHLILQPLLLRRIKADVEHLLPRKREYILYAPLTKQQTDLYNVISNTTADTRKYLVDTVIKQLTVNFQAKSLSSEIVLEDSTDENLQIQENSRIKIKTNKREKSSITQNSKNAFQQMMSNQLTKSNGTITKKRKAQEKIIPPPAKVNKSNKNSTPNTSLTQRKTKRKINYSESQLSEEDALSDDEFEAKLIKEMATSQFPPSSEQGKEDTEMSKMAELAKREIGNKKLGNPVMQLRLTCNSPHNFYNLRALNPDQKIDESIVTSSGKMLLLDRLLPELFKRGSKVLIFSQFKTQLDILEDYANDLRNWNVCRIDGSVNQEERRQQIKKFNEDTSYRIFLLSTRAGGQGINLASADTVILFDSDWNPQQDLQAQDRAHRIGQKNPVIIYRLATRGTVEEDLLLSADAKRRLEKLVIKKGDYKSMVRTTATSTSSVKKDGLTNNDNYTASNQDDDDDNTSKSVSGSSLSEDTLKNLLLKDGLVYQYKSGDEILSTADLEILCDRSPEAYDRAASGLSDCSNYCVVETKPDAFISCISNSSNINNQNNKNHFSNTSKSDNEKEK
ncbi:putative iswi chromatin-remodeling complex atpase isw2 [Erysiphe necator]|uniref:Putative iswi chromatin-remodeling complex atpase isw2 n=1 Tax=Uncinula necator TaxID=52586 RepID=A0A0B1P066_UNCNE|nr:putative iswi chromatin-remodeling complex atpase isw2 [Erysiphe necator]